MLKMSADIARQKSSFHFHLISDQISPHLFFCGESTILSSCAESVFGLGAEENVMGRFAFALAAAAMLASPVMAAAPCKDSKGKFIKCPTAVAKPAGKCRDAKGHFAKCGTPGAKPA
jgi:hypothetical protein